MDDGFTMDDVEDAGYMKVGLLGSTSDIRSEGWGGAVGGRRSHYFTKQRAWDIGSTNPREVGSLCTRRHLRLTTDPIGSLQEEPIGQPCQECERRLGGKS